MTATGTTNYNPAAANLTLVAFGRIGIRRTEITSQHMVDADNEANLLQAELSNKNPNMWRSELYTQALTAGTATYVLPARLIAMQAAYITTTTGGTSFDRIIWPLSAYEYAALPDKTVQAPPTCYRYDRLITPTITLWQVPDSAATYVLNLRICSQIQDASQASGITLNMPYRFLDVYVAGLAHRLARLYAPDKEQLRKQDYLEAWANAAAQDTDDQVSMYIMPDLSSAWRR